jgi:hypothetical protein
LKAKDLIEILAKHPEFDVDFCIVEPEHNGWGLVRKFNITGLEDVGYSSEVIRLQVEEDI